jgi:hypothetical protein
LSALNEITVVRQRRRAQKKVEVTEQWKSPDRKKRKKPKFRASKLKKKATALISLGLTKESLKPKSSKDLATSCKSIGLFSR